MDETLLTAAEAADLAGVDVGTIRQARFRKRLLPAKREMRGNKPEYLFKREDVLAVWPAKNMQEDKTA